MKTIKELPINSLIKDPNTTYMGKPIIWRIVDKNHVGYPENSVTIMTDKFITLKTFDAKEPDNPNPQRAANGNNRYRTSNVRQWLNSDGVANSWWHAQNLPNDNGNDYNNHDAPPREGLVSILPYIGEDGFLRNVSEGFKSNIINTQIVCAKNSNTDGGGLETFLDTFFIPSVNELGYTGTTGEGTVFSAFSTTPCEGFYPTAELAELAKDLADTDINKITNYYGTRTAYQNSCDRIHTALTGTPTSMFAYYCYGLPICCNLYETVMVTDAKDTDGTYIILSDSTVEETTPLIIADKFGSLDVITDKFDITYSVYDTNSRVLGITETLDDTEIRQYAMFTDKDATMTAEIAGVDWLKLSNGWHTFKITASNGVNTGEYSVTFYKNQTSLSVTMIDPLEIDENITNCMIKVVGDIPDDAVIKYEVSNNASDDEPIWENCTEEVKSESVHEFQSEGNSFNFKITISRGSSEIGGYITEVSGWFGTDSSEVQTYSIGG